MANVIFMDGFDAYDGGNNNTTRPGLHSKWILAGWDNIYFTNGRYGGQAMHMGDSVYQNTIMAFFNGNTFYQSATIAFAVLYSNIAKAEAHSKCFTLLHDQDDQFAFDVSNIGQGRLWRGNTLVAISDPNIFRTNDWHYVELEYVGHSSSGRATLYVDGVQVLTFTSNTQNQGPYGFNGFKLHGGNGSGIFWDDMYVLDEATRIGERRIETLRPNGDIVGNQFTPSTGSTGYETLDDALVSADDYVSATLQGATDYYNFTNLSTTPDTIDAVQLNVWATKTDAQTRQMQTLIKSGSTITTSQSHNLPTNHLNMNRIENKDPATNAPWTPSAVNALQAGFKISL